MRQDRFLCIAKKLSEKSDHHSHKLGCVIARGSKILGMGYNILSKKSVKSPHCFYSIHAEFRAVTDAKFNVDGAVAYIYRQTKDGKPAISRPCESCSNFLKSCGIKRIVYTFENTFKMEKIS